MFRNNIIVKMYYMMDLLHSKLINIDVAIQLLIECTFFISMLVPTNIT